MGDILYTISSTKVKANDLTNLNEVNFVDFPYEQRYYYGYAEGIAGVVESIEGGTK